MKTRKWHDILKELKEIDFYKTFIANLTVLDWYQRLLFPIYIYKGSRLFALNRNCFEFRITLRHGILRIGMLLLQVSDGSIFI